MQRLDEAIENLKLNEAFSDSMPDWLRRRMQKDSMQPVKFYNKFGSDSSSFKLKNHEFPARYQGETNLARLFLKNGYDLSKMNVISAPVPDSMDNDISEDPMNLVIYHIVTPEDDKIYVPGLNDDERYTTEADKQSAFKYLNNTSFKKYVKDFAYVRLDDDSTHVSDEVQANRIQRDPNAYFGNTSNITGRLKRQDDYSRVLHTNDQNVRISPKELKNKWGADQFDKSGYYRGSKEGILSSVLVTRLADKLRELRKTKWVDYIAEVDKQYKKAQQLLGNCMEELSQNSMIWDAASREEYSKVMGAIRDLKEGQSYTIRTAERVRQRLEAGEQPEDYMFDEFLRSCDRLKAQAKEVINNFKQYEYAPAEFIW